MPSGKIVHTQTAQAPMVCEHQQCKQRLWPGSNIHTVEIQWPDDKVYTHVVGDCCVGEFDR
jgi:hypothetical protein